MLLPAAHYFPSFDAWLESLGTKELDISLPDLASFITKCLPCENAMFPQWKHYTPTVRGNSDSRHQPL